MSEPYRFPVWALLLLSVLPCRGDPGGPPVGQDPGPSAAARPFLERLKGFTSVSLGHTTDAIPMRPERRAPEPPQPFPAGRFKAIFEVSGQLHAILIQTEQKIPHYALVTPGETDTGGLVQIFLDTSAESPEGPILTRDETDDLLRIVYARFCRPLDPATSTTLNQLKDMLLAVRFGSVPGIRQYHGGLVDQVASGALCR